MKQQTAVEWLVEEIKADDWWYLPESMKEDIIQQAKQMEKEQIDEAYKLGQIVNSLNQRDNDEEYNEIFKSE